MNALARGLALLVLGWMVLGFGLCGAFGVLGGVVSLFGGSHGEPEGAWLFLVPGLVGLLIAYGAWKGMTALLRKPRTPAEP